MKGAAEDPRGRTQGRDASEDKEGTKGDLRESVFRYYDKHIKTASPAILVFHEQVTRSQSLIFSGKMKKHIIQVLSERARSCCLAAI